MEETKYSPMVMQYLEIKKEYQDTLILFRLGDFYELFFEDAEIASKELDLVLTGKNAGVEERIPMCGVPFHAINSYIETLVHNGHKVGIVEQLEDPATVKKGIVKRDVIQVITPGTLINLGLDEKNNNYIAYVDDYTDFFCLAYCDLSTGEIYTINLEHDINLVIDELISLEVKEIVSSFKFKEKYHKDIAKRMMATFTISEMEAMPLETFEITQEITDTRVAVTISKLIYLLINTAKRPLDYLKVAKQIKNSQFMHLDGNSAINLELTRTVKSEDRYGSLFYLLDKTKTAMGARLLKRFILKPLYDESEINSRLDKVEVFTKDFVVRNELRGYLNEVYDLERLIAKVSFGSANARDLLQLKKSFIVMGPIKRKLEELHLNDLAKNIETLDEMVDRIERAIVDNPPLTIKEGGMFKHGYDTTLDDLKFASSDGKSFIAALEAKERERTGIKTLKVGFNKVFGYYIEVSNSFIPQIKDEYNYIRKQTTTTSERYITPELKEKEKFILTADDKIMALEYELFVELKDYVATLTKKIQSSADAISFLDVLLSLSEVSMDRGYVRPSFNKEGKVHIVSGRHPVMEAISRNCAYIPNDVEIEDKRLIIISGPNMGGKSTFMRQVAVISIMAQIGCFVPAETANLSLFDGIYTRIGASDDMISGQSTFMVEMNEVNYALKHATANSLIIFDEVGRGTATFDGMALAQAIIEYIALHIKSITLFSTHYHELTSLANQIPTIGNLHASVIEEEDTITFLYKMMPGATNKSYGINVARLASMPEELLERARVILKANEANKSINTSVQVVEVCKNELPDFVEELSTLNPLEMSPLQAIDYLYKLTQKVKEHKHGKN